MSDSLILDRKRETSQGLRGLSDLNTYRSSVSGADFLVEDELLSENVVPVTPQADVVDIATMALPKEMASAVDELLNLQSLQPDWDSYGARAIEPASILQAVYVLKWIIERFPNVPRPYIVPTNRGGVQLEWHKKVADLEIGVETESIVAYYQGSDPRDEWEDDITNDPTPLEMPLMRLAGQL